jgi:hypothetical protein
MIIEFQHLTRRVLPGDPSLSEKGENLSDALTAPFVACAVLSACIAYMLILCSSGQTGVISTETAIIYYHNNNIDGDDDNDNNETNNDNNNAVKEFVRLLTRFLRHLS